MSRVVTDRDGSKWQERDLGHGVERTLIPGGLVVYLQRYEQSSPAPVKPEPAPQTSAAPSWYLPSDQLEHVELRSRAEPRLTIALRGSVRHSLFEFARDSRDGTETGGFMYGEDLISWKPRVSVGWVTSAVAERAESSATLDIEASISEKSILRASGAVGVSEQGIWHTHPSQDGEPSSRDLAAWASGLDHARRFGASRYVGLILTAGASDIRWQRPKIHGWVVRRHSNGRAICEPASVELG